MELSQQFDIPMLNTKSKLFKALGNPLRLAMVYFLAKQERSVSQIVAFSDAKMSNVSRHLAILRTSGVVVARKSGNVVYYRLNLPFISQLLLMARDDISGYSYEKTER